MKYTELEKESISQMTRQEELEALQLDCRGYHVHVLADLAVQSGK